MPTSLNKKTKSRRKRSPTTNRYSMKQFVVIAIMALCSANTAWAQSFLDRLQKKSPGKASVTVNQDNTVSELVNSANIGGNSQTAKRSVSAAGTAKTQVTSTAKTPSHTETAGKKTAGGKADNTEKEKIEVRTGKTVENADSGNETPSVDLRKKVVRNSYKINGYRVQVFAGGNSRRDRQDAERIGNNIKMKFPDEPVYVHFYSPRWICRMGNYRTYEEAHRILLEIKQLGYRQASIVKGKISVQY